MNRTHEPLMLCATVAALVACGGGGGDSSTPTPPAPAPTFSASGVVVEAGAVQGATVCLDLNSSASCDAGEPASAATDAQGRFTISAITEAQQALAAPFVASVPAAALDAGTAVGAAHVLMAPGGKPELISPISTLVQSGVRQALTLSVAQTRSAAQTGVGEAALYANYVGATGADADAARTAQAEIVAVLKTGAVLSLSGFEGSGVADYFVRELNYADGKNYTLRYFATSNVTDSSGLFTWYDLRVGKAAGADMPASALYDDAQRLTAQGWVTLDASTAHSGSPRSPYVASWSAYQYSGSRIEIDVSGRPVAEVVATAQDSVTNDQITLAGVNAAALTGTMPAGSLMRRQTTTTTYAPLTYRASDGTVGGTAVDTASLIARFPVPAAPTAANTVSMGNLHPSADCTAGCPAERLRVAFAPANVAQYYLCDLTGTVTSNCVAAGTGSYAVGTGVDGATPIVTFAGLPAAAAVQTVTRVFVQRSGAMWFGFQAKLETVRRTSVNRTAFGAIAPQIGIAAPAVPAL